MHQTEGLYFLHELVSYVAVYIKLHTHIHQYSTMQERSRGNNSEYFGKYLHDIVLMAERI